MPHLETRKKSIVILSPNRKTVLARVQGTGRTSRNKARVIQRRLEGQRRLVFTGSKKTKIPRSIGTFKQFRAFQRSQRRR